MIIITTNKAPKAMMRYSLSPFLCSVRVTLTEFELYGSVPSALSKVILTEAFRAGFGAIHNRMTAIQAERVFEIVEPFTGGLIA